MSTVEQTVFIVDDDAAVRDALCMLLKSVGVAVESYSSAKAFLEQFDSTMPGCLVLDIRMPGMSGLELQQALIEQHSILPIIFITGHGDIPMAVQAIKDGAIDFITKPFRDQDLLDSINNALSQDEANRDEQFKREEIRQRFDSLTRREHEVLDLVVAGKANKVIAIELNLSQRTVEIHRSHVMEKMETRSLAQLVKLISLVHEPVSG